jgi:excisionase family DNA binding protein
MKLIGANKLKAFRVGRDFRVRESDLKEFIEREE